MADVKISGLPSATTPLVGSEVLPIVQSGVTRQVSIDNLTANKSVSANVFNGGLNAVSNIMQNGDFASADGWTLNGTASIAGGVLITPANSYGAKSVPTVIGMEYTLIVTLVSGSSRNIIRAGNAAFASQNLNIGYLDANATYTYTFVATYATTWFTFIADSGAGTTSNWDNVIVYPSILTPSIKLTTGNLVIGTSGKGIDFSATPGTGTSELLADYEEGTWTPNFSAWTTAPTVTAASCQYTKVGRQVTVCLLASGGICGSTGQAITGLPFTSAAASVASFRDVSGGGATTFGGISYPTTQISSITAATFTGLFWTMSATYFV